MSRRLSRLTWASHGVRLNDGDGRLVEVFSPLWWQFWRWLAWLLWLRRGRASGTVTFAEHAPGGEVQYRTVRVLGVAPPPKPRPVPFVP